MANISDAYTDTQTASMSPREIEAFCLTRSALMMNDIRRDWDGRKGQLDEVLEKNKILWVALTSKINDEDNPLPVELKQNMANLAVFIFKRIMDIYVDPQPEKLDVLININRNIAAGLRGDAG